MKIIRQGPRRGRKPVAKYDAITTSTAYGFMLQLAQHEADSTPNCKHIALIGGELSGRAEAVLVGLNGSHLATYSQEW